MKRDLDTLPVTGTIQDVETLLNSTAVKGFPIVDNDARQSLIGYIGRREVRYVIGVFSTSPVLGGELTDGLERASKLQHVRPDTLCSFAAEDPHAEGEVPSLSTPGLRSAGPIVAIEDELSAEVVESTSTHGVIKFWPWVQQVMSTQPCRMGPH